ncbi:MAG: hypothetical protein WC058_16320 [Phycisphaeraceae bacterium]
MTDLGTLDGVWVESEDHAINDYGRIAGYAYSPTTEFVQAFLYSGSVMANLGTLGGTNSYASGINNLGNVVGKAQVVGDIYHAFLYSDSMMADLNDCIASGSGWLLQNAVDINDVGQIVGVGINPQGQTRAFLLTPIPEPTSDVSLA